MICWRVLVLMNGLWPFHASWASGGAEWSVVLGIGRSTEEESGQPPTRTVCDDPEVRYTISWEWSQHPRTGGRQ